MDCSNAVTAKNYHQTLEKRLGIELSLVSSESAQGCQHFDLRFPTSRNCETNSYCCKIPRLWYGSHSKANAEGK